ncbi:MAG: UPF0182 family protein [Spirochaetia bacterium]
MFTVLGILILAVGTLPLLRTLKNSGSMEQKTLTTRLIRGALVFLGTIVLLILINVFFHIYSEHLWFGSLGQESRFWTEIFTKIILFAVGFVIAFAFLFWNLKSAAGKVEGESRSLIAFPASILLAAIMGSWALGLWENVLLFINQTTAQTTDPVFNRPVNFYLFSLSFYQAAVSWLIFLLVAAAAGVILTATLRYSRARGFGSSSTNAILHTGGLRRQVVGLAGLFLLALAWNAYLSVFELMYSEAGVVTGAGWSDINIRVPAYYVTLAIYAAAGVTLLVAGFSKRVERKVLMLEAGESGEGTVPTKKSLIAPAGIVAVLIIANGIVPIGFQSLVVSPNEITMEDQYIRHNIDYTRRAFGLDESNLTQEQYPVGRDITPEVIEGSREMLDNVRLWDPGALKANLRQQQEIRLYYRFADVDIDRYRVDGEYRQMMLSVRELEKSQLPPSSQTWVSQHLKYTHGYGLVMLPVHEVVEQGGPKLLIRGIPPEVDIDGFQVTRPEIYYGELTTDHVYTNTSEQEFDYPSGDENVYSDYEGEGGVVLDNIVKRFMYAWKFDGHRQLFSGYFDADSRILFDRQITDRARKIAPFLRFDDDPYPVLTEEGRIKYIIDAYTVSANYPYSERYAGSVGKFGGANYMRNSVKVVIDAYNGSMQFYAMDPDDIILSNYDRVFPDLFTPFEQMPEFLKNHIRYPTDFFTVQAEMLRTYNMTDVATFYQREDAWEFATERYRGAFEPVRPYYIMVEYPESDQLEFVLMIPFTPKNKNVINAWMAGRSDTPNYGDLTTFTMPKGVEVLGPRQIEARIDQDAEMSRSLSLWSQRGSDVIRGNLLTVPLFDSGRLYMLFAEPIFLQAESAELPELRRVVLADQDQVVWARTFDAALQLLVGELQPAAAGDAAPAGTQAVMDPQSRRLIGDAADTFDTYKQELSDGNFAAAGEALEELNTLLEDITDTLEGEAAGAGE